MQEITMIVLKIYVYVMSLDTENPKLYEDYDVPKLIYDEWIIDIPKILDIMALYSGTNPEIVTFIINQAFKMNPEQEEDFKGLVEILNTNIFDSLYKELI